MNTLIGIGLSALRVAVPFVIALTIWSFMDYKGIMKKPGSYKQMFASIIKRRRRVIRDDPAAERVTDEQIQSARKRMVETVNQEI